MGWKRELLKKWRLRLSVILILLAGLVFSDEAIKEGYGFDPSDLFNPAITHEKIFIILLILGIILGLRVRNK